MRRVLSLAAASTLLVAAPLVLAQSQSGMRDQDYQSQQRYMQTERETTSDTSEESEYMPRWQQQMSPGGFEGSEAARDPSEWREQRGARSQFGTRISGEIDRLVYANFDDNTHVFARINTDSGRPVITYLGPEDKIERLDLNVGDRVTVFGRPDVLEAVAVAAHGQRVAITPLRAAFAARARDDSGAGRALIRGEIENLRAERMRMRMHLIADVRTLSGQTKTVDLGPIHRLSRLDLNEGDQITVTGFAQNVRGEPLIRALRVQANGEVVRTGAGLVGLRERAGQWARDMDGGAAQDNQCGGEIVRLQHASFEGLTEDHLVGTLRDENTGRFIKIDFGPLSEAHAINLRLGDNVKVRGERGQIENEDAILAKSVYADNQAYRIDQDTTQKSRKMEASSSQTRY